MVSGYLTLKKNVYVLLVFFLFIFVVSAFSASAQVTHIANSQDWKDVYSVMLYSSLEGDKGIFLNSESIGSLNRFIDQNSQIFIYESDDRSYVNSLDSQLSSSGYTVVETSESSSFNTELVPDVDEYYLISEGNFRLSISLIPYAIQENAWIFIVNEDNVDDVVDFLDEGKPVRSFGNFPRDVYSELEEFVTEQVNSGSLYKDSQEIASRLDDLTSVVLADGSVLEGEFFATSNAVLLSGFNKILDDTHTFLKEEGVKSVVIVGNNLAVVGEQIRTRSNKEISVFIKYGQTSTRVQGQVYALLTFPLPDRVQDLRVNEVIYDPANNQIVAYFENTGNVGVNQLTTLRVVTPNEETIGDASDASTVYISEGEILPVSYPLELPLDQLDNAAVIFYTSFGSEPEELDTFLTMENSYGPPFMINLTVKELLPDESSLVFHDVVYYNKLKRIGVDLENNGSVQLHYNLYIKDIIVNGVTQTLDVSGSLDPAVQEIVYLPVELDEVDQIENEEFSVAILYGEDEDALLKVIKDRKDFVAEGGNFLTGNAISALKGSLPITLVLVVVVVIIALRVRKQRKAKE